MNKAIVLGIVGVLGGCAVGMVVMSALHMASMFVYPAPEGIDIFDPAQAEAAQAWMSSLPAGAFLLAAIAHWLGAGTGAALATLVSGRQKLVWARIVGVIFTLAGIANLMQTPHPGWFAFVDLPGYLIFTELCGRWLLRPKSQA